MSGSYKDEVWSCEKSFNKGIKWKKKVEIVPTKSFENVRLESVTPDFHGATCDLNLVSQFCLVSLFHVPIRERFLRHSHHLSTELLYRFQTHSGASNFASLVRRSRWMTPFSWICADHVPMKTKGVDRSNKLIRKTSRRERIYIC